MFFFKEQASCIRFLMKQCYYQIIINGLLLLVIELNVAETMYGLN